MSSDPPLPQPIRLNYILAHLSENTHATRAQLASICNCTTRTIQRDIEELTTTYRHAIASSQIGYHFRKPSAAETNPSDNRLLATLLLAGANIDRHLHTFAPETAQKLSQKFLKLPDLPPTADPHRILSPAPIHFSETLLKTFGKCAKSILNQTNLEIHHTPISLDTGIWRQVHPVQLRQRENQWYLAAFDYHKNAPRTFALTRIGQLRTPAKPKPVPSETTTREILEGATFSIWDTGGTPEKVEIKLHDYAARIIQEQEIHPSQKLEIITADQVILTLFTSDFTGLALWLRRFTPFVQILSPHALKESFTRDLKTALDLNSKK